jgi:ABC-type Fe3+/spermidine/putrescine transport system ATPase subunit
MWMVNTAGSTGKYRYLLGNLAGLCDPASGSINIDGISIKDFVVEEHRGNIRVIFQDYAKYHEM